MSDLTIEAEAEQADHASFASVPPAEGGEPGVAGNAGPDVVDNGATDRAMKLNILKCPDEWAEENTNVRAVIGVFWETKPLRHLIPCRMVFYCNFWTSDSKAQADAEWKLAQRAREARAINRDDPLRRPAHTVCWSAPRNTAENEAMAKLKGIMKPSGSWTGFVEPEPNGLTVHTRQVGFRLAARAGCCLQQAMISPQAGKPGKTHRIPWEPELAEELQSLCAAGACRGGLVDPWSFGIWKQFPSVGLLQSRACKVVTLSVLMLGCVGTARISSLQSTILTLSVCVVVHTHTLTRALGEGCQRGMVNASDTEIDACCRQFRLAGRLGGGPEESH